MQFFKRNLIIWGVLGSMGLSLVGCAKFSPINQGQTVIVDGKAEDRALPESPVLQEDDLIPTLPFDNKTPSAKGNSNGGGKKSGVENIPTRSRTIGTGSRQLILGQLSVLKPRGVYDVKSKKFKFSGEAQILDLKTTIDLEGDVVDGTGVLWPRHDDASGAQFRGNIYCLGENADGTFSCDQYFVDIYVLYKGQKFADQYQVNRPSSKATTKDGVGKSPKTDASPGGGTPPKNSGANTPAPDKVPDASDEEDDMGDDVETGRYVGGSDHVDVLFDAKNAKEAEKSVTVVDGDCSAKAQLCTINGVLRPVNQAIGLVNRGSLTNASDFLAMLQAQPTLNFVSVAKDQTAHYGTFEMMETLKVLANRAASLVTGYKLRVGAISAKKGGNIGHRSHKTGLDADIGYMTTSTPSTLQLENVVERAAASRVKSSFLYKENFDLFKSANATGMLQMVIVDHAIKKQYCQDAKARGLLTADSEEGKLTRTLLAKMLDRVHDSEGKVRLVKGHDNHFHMRLHCGKYQKRCFEIKFEPTSAGCD